MGPDEQQLIKSVQQSIKRYLVTQIDETEAALQNESYRDEMSDAREYVLEEDPYRKKLLAGMKMSKSWIWPWKMILVPLDDDFIYLAYRVILRRDPDLIGFLSFQDALAKGMARVNVLITLDQSQEAAALGNPETGKRLMKFLDKSQRLCKKLPLLERFYYSVWVKVTSHARMMRLVLIMRKAREDLAGVEKELVNVRNDLSNSEKERVELRMRLDDTIEYFNNQKRFNTYSVLNGNSALNGKNDYGA